MSKKIIVELFIDIKFIAIIPALNINLHSKSLEFEWLIFAIYIDFKQKQNEKNNN